MVKLIEQDMSQEAFTPAAAPPAKVAAYDESPPTRADEDRLDLLENQRQPQWLVRRTNWGLIGLYLLSVAILIVAGLWLWRP